MPPQQTEMQIPNNGASSRRKIMITVASVVAVSALVCAGLFVASKFVRINFALQPNPNGKQLVAARATATRFMDKSLDDVSAKTDFTVYATATDDSCNKGEDGERPATFSNQCNLRMTRFYGFSGDFAGSMYSLQSDLSQQGWPVEDGYYEHQVQVVIDEQNQGPAGAPISAGGGMGASVYKGYSLEMNYGNNYYAGHDGGFLIGEQADLDNDNPPLSATFYHHRQFVNNAALLKSMDQTKNTYLLAISIYTTYFVN